ncbi:MAG: hypothetical protein R6U96_04620 [Promethearchaeia archaeon]
MQVSEIDNLAKILDALHHYWFVKGVISDKMMSKALFKLEHRQNPFLDEDFVRNLRENAAKKNYQINHDAFYVKLANDEEGN